MSTYNDLNYLPKCLDSIFTQNSCELELVIVDDGSTDGTRDYLRSLRERRVVVINNQTNRGLTRSLIEGMNQARGEFIARIDSDEICAPGRLAKQVSRFRTRPSLVLLGGSACYIDENSKQVGSHRCLINDEEIRWASGLKNPLFGTTIMMRRDTLIRNNLNYSPDFETAQDYDLSLRLSEFGKVGNLPDVLTYSRLRRGITNSRSNSQKRNHVQIAQKAMNRWLGHDLPTIDHINDWLALLNSGRWKSVQITNDRAELSRLYRHAFEQFCLRTIQGAGSSTRKRAERLFLSQAVHMLLRQPMGPHEWKEFQNIVSRWPNSLSHYARDVCSGAIRRCWLNIQRKPNLR